MEREDHEVPVQGRRVLLLSAGGWGTDGGPGLVLSGADPGGRQDKGAPCLFQREGRPRGGRRGAREARNAMALDGRTESKDAYVEHEGGWRGRCYSRSVCT